MLEPKITAEEIWREIEFEFSHRSISSSELNESLQVVKHYQQKLRLELGQATRRSDFQRLLNRQLQLNDMLLTLLQQVDQSMQQSQREMQRLKAFSVNGNGALHPENDHLAPVKAPQPRYEALTGQLESLMKPEALWLDLEVAPSRLPVVGPLLTRLRVTLHRLTFFYVARLTARQAAVNQVYGETLLRIITSLNQLETDNNKG